MTQRKTNASQKNDSLPIGTPIYRAIALKRKQLKFQKAITPQKINIS